MKLLIIRHSDPDYEIDSITEKGKHESLLLRDRLLKQNISDIYCSPLGRAKATADPTLQALGKNAEICDWLREFDGYIIDPDMGNKRIPWGLMPRDWTVEDYYDNKKWLETPLMQSGNVKEKYNIVCAGIDKIIEKHGYVRSGNIYKVECANCETIVIFCHFAVECVMLSHLFGISPMILWHTFSAAPSSVSTIITEECERGVMVFRLRSFGDISHLYAGNEEPSFPRFHEIYSNYKE